MEIVGVILIEITIVLFIAFLYSYANKKAENLATKEDVSEITREIEAVKHEYSSKLESVKSNLGARLFTYQVRYQNEFSLLMSLSEKLAALRDALADLETQVLANQPNADNSISTKEKAEKTLAAMGALIREYEAHKPFYPEEIYESVRKLHGLSWTKLVLKADEANVIERSTAYNALIDVAKNQDRSGDAEEISETIDQIYGAIRKRAQYWEELQA